MSSRRKRFNAANSSRGSASPQGFSSRSLGTYGPLGSFSGGSLGTASTAYPVRGSYAGRPITAVTVNQSLLTPLKLDIDPNIQAVREKEKDQIKTLNNKFASVIDKVRHLEQQNKMLEAKWEVMNSGGSKPKSRCEPLLKNYIQSLEAHLQQLAVDRQNLQQQLKRVSGDVEDHRQKYEDEINKRTGAENEFVLLKKDVDNGYLLQTELEDKLASLIQDINLFKTLYDEEVQELQAEMKDVSVIVQMDNSRDLDMKQLVEDVRAQYEAMAHKSRQEAEAWYKTKYEMMSSQADMSSEELRTSKQQIADLKRHISRLQNDISSVKSQCGSLNSQIADAEAQGEAALEDAKAKLRDLEAALQKAKQDMAKQVRDYQDLMNTKLALDIEIATYHHLLEGEENRIEQDAVVRIQNNSHRPRTRKLSASKVLIKVTETHEDFTDTNN
ncbi:keratin, type II cytoskeletal 8 [Engraulis encrasicolus]|uniref:keratin, type II cytoskeletal 8 n=1 Tax=Engraulis encrasicolus TaxID=184585 RepID=UPI002FD3E750